ncbi:uncharacterized protein LOC129575315 [Sitodiplosis mosellana]|uniref:uncharacterized protein LOC129575315 n=1 Tax=Sitodiplosis mosellana TaxID=263140 RepID=UPI00244440EB|nr:uncharacterized protein LOC129575315 [Sitodiplosis mosellana]
MDPKLQITMNHCAIVLFVVCNVLFVDVHADVSSIDGIKTFPSTTSSTSPENSNSFSILTKEFLNKPDGSEVGKRNSQKPSGRNPARDNAISATDNNLPESDESDERQAYYYPKPKTPFELGTPQIPESTNIHTNTVPPKNDDIEDFDGYQYPKPSRAFPFPPTTTSNPDAESLPTDSARLRKL